MKKVLLWLLVLTMCVSMVASFSLVGCKKEAAPAEEEAVEEAEEVETVEEEAPAEEEVAEEELINIVYIPKNEGNPYFDSIINGFKDAGEELGYEFVTVAPATAEATSQLPFIKDQIQRGVDVLAISPNSPDALNSVFDEAREAGILVMIVNSDIPGSEEHRDLAILPMDFDVTGSAQVELLGSLIDYEGEIAIVSATTDAPDQNYWIEGMKEALKDSKYAKMELVDVVYGDDDPQKSLTEMEGLLIKWPNLRGVISPTTVGVAACAQAVETAGKGSPIIEVIGLGTPNQMRRFLKDGVISAFQLWSPYNEGYLSGYLAVGIIKGEIIVAEGNTFTVPGLGEREFYKDNVVKTQLAPTDFTIDNIDDYDF